MKTVEITTDFIKLSQLLKLADFIGQGSDAKMIITEGLVSINGEVVTERGKKVKPEDIVEVKDMGKVQIIRG